MPTIIRRSAEIGDPRLVRIPFAEPSVTPASRLSALNFNGVHGAAAIGIEDAGATSALFTNGTGVNPVYQVGADGVPAYRFAQPLDGSLDAAKTIHRSAIGGSARAFSAVAKIYALPASTAGGSVAHACLVRAAASIQYGIYIEPITNRVIGMAGPLGRIEGPVMPMDGQYHFFALSYLTTPTRDARLYFDDIEIVKEGTGADIPSDSRLLIGYDTSGADYAIVEGSAYTSALARADVVAKRKHYRSLYQF